MPRALTGLTAAAALVLSAVSAFAQEVPPCRSRSVNVEHADHIRKSDAAAGLLCLQGSPARIHLEVRQTTITVALSALLAAYKISYRSSIALNETRDGVYAGSLDEVVSRLLKDYDYVIKPGDSTLDIVIFARTDNATGKQPLSAPIAAEVAEKPVRREARVSRIR